MKNYKYTENWFFSDDLKKFLPLNNQNEFHILEIGSFEGKSTVWFLENLLQHPKSTITCIDPWTSYSQNTNSFNSYSQDNAEWDFSTHKDTFLYNIIESNESQKVITHQGYSHKVLPILITQDKKYDLIFIDGNHTSPFVLTDAVMSWYLLHQFGTLLFDDYLWESVGPTCEPKLAIDSFTNVFKDYHEVIWEGNRKAIKKLQ